MLYKSSRKTLLVIYLQETYSLLNLKFLETKLNVSLFTIKANSFLDYNMVWLRKRNMKWNVVKEGYDRHNFFKWLQLDSNPQPLSS